MGVMFEMLEGAVTLSCPDSFWKSLHGETAAGRVVSLLMVASREQAPAGSSRTPRTDAVGQQRHERADDGLASKMTSDAPTSMRYAVLLSGSGRTLENLLRAIEDGELDGDIVAVVSSRPGVRGLDVAWRAGIPAMVVDRKGFAYDLAFSEAIYEAIAPFDPQLILLAGFLRKLHVEPAWEDRVLNIHPALLPEMAAASGRGFYGDRVHAAVLESGASRSGATVHVVDNGYDTGRVVMTEEVAVLPSDSVHDLAARVFAAECRLYPRAVSWYVAQHGSWIHRAPGAFAKKS